MFKRLLIVLTLALAVSLPPQAAVTGTEQSLRQVTLEVGNMTCGMCKYTVENALKQVDGVRSAKVDLTQGTALVTFDSAKAKVETLVKAVTDAGYPASVRE